MLSAAAGEIVPATPLHGWHNYPGFAVVEIGVFIGFIRWNCKY
jgi:hypothetical protein